MNHAMPLQGRFSFKTLKVDGGFKMHPRLVMTNMLGGSVFKAYLTADKMILQFLQYFFKCLDNYLLNSVNEI